LVDDDSEVSPLASKPQIRDVGNPNPARPLRLSFPNSIRVLCEELMETRIGPVDPRHAASKAGETH
jgi:hypothetical protein